MPHRRWSPVELELLQLLEHHPTRKISLDDLAAQLGRDRRVIQWAVGRLKHRQRLQVAVPGRGRTPHTYQLAG